MNLKKILEFINDVLENPSNLMNLSLYKADSLSPTSPISDYENNNNDSHSSFEMAAKKFTLRKLSNNFSPPTTNNNNNNKNNNGVAALQVDLSPLNGRHKKPASHLNSDDDYVWYTAIDENMGLRRTGLVVQQNRQRHVHGNVVNGNVACYSTHFTLGLRKRKSVAPNIQIASHKINSYTKNLQQTKIHQTKQ